MDPGMSLNILLATKEQLPFSDAQRAEIHNNYFSTTLHMMWKTEDSIPSVVHSKML